MRIRVCDRDDAKRLIARRRALGHDRYDEVWNGVYVMAAVPSDEHQEIVSALTWFFESLIVSTGLGKVRPGTNISDRAKGWKKNYRCPDVAVFLNGGAAVRYANHWY